MTLRRLSKCTSPQRREQQNDSYLVHMLRKAYLQLGDCPLRLYMCDALTCLQACTHALKPPERSMLTQTLKAAQSVLIAYVTMIVTAFAPMQAHARTCANRGFTIVRDVREPRHCLRRPSQALRCHAALTSKLKVNLVLRKLVKLAHTERELVATCCPTAEIQYPRSSRQFAQSHHKCQGAYGALVLPWLVLSWRNSHMRGVFLDMPNLPVTVTFSQLPTRNPLWQYKCLQSNVVQGRGKSGLNDKQQTDLEAAVARLEADRGVKVVQPLNLIDHLAKISCMHKNQLCCCCVSKQPSFSVIHVDC